jgi:hypothetical protein
LVFCGLAAGWYVSGLLTPSERTTIFAGTARAVPSDYRPFGPDE